MAKKVAAMVKLQIQAGQANPSPPVGPALGQHGVNIMEFCKAFNARTQGQEVAACRFAAGWLSARQERHRASTLSPGQPNPR
jgi:hypothetical protein